MWRWYDWLHEMKNRDEVKRMVEHQKLVSRVIKSADGSARLLHEITKPTAWRESRADSGEGRRRCQAFGQMWRKEARVGETLAVW